MEQMNRTEGLRALIRQGLQAIAHNDTLAHLGVECQHVVHPPSLEAGGFLPRAECGRKKL